MSEAAQALLSKALELPVEDQHWLTDRLIEETEEDEDDAEWQAELDRRLEEVEKHPERLLDFDETMKEIRQELQAARRRGS
jgi:Putative addiction module component